MTDVELRIVEVLLKNVLSAVLEWDWDENEAGPDFEGLYAQRIRDVGVHKVLRMVYRVVLGSMGTSVLMKLCFVWKDMAYSDWLLVLAEPPDLEPLEVSRFELFFSGYLALSFHQSVEDSSLPEDLKRRVIRDVGSRVAAGPLWGHVEDVFANRGLDVWKVWRGLAATGGRMLVSDERLK